MKNTHLLNERNKALVVLFKQGRAQPQFQAVSVLREANPLYDEFTVVFSLLYPLILVLLCYLIELS